MNSIVIFKDTTVYPGGMSLGPKNNPLGDNLDDVRHVGPTTTVDGGTVPARGTKRMREILRSARQDGTVKIGCAPSKPASNATLAYLARQERKRNKASGKMAQPKGRKAKVVETPSQTIQVKGPDLYTLCSMIEAGKLPVTALSPWLGGNVTSDTIQEWYLREQSARNLAEVRVRNGGSAKF